MKEYCKTIRYYARKGFKVSILFCDWMVLYRNGLNLGFDTKERVFTQRVYTTQHEHRVYIWIEQ